MGSYIVKSCRYGGPNVSVIFNLVPERGIISLPLNYSVKHSTQSSTFSSWGSKLVKAFILFSPHISLMSYRFELIEILVVGKKELFLLLRKWHIVRCVLASYLSKTRRDRI